MTFGDGDESVKMEFKWADVFKGSNWTSKNINFEYYTILYNLAITYYLLGIETTREAKLEDYMLKDGIKFYQYAGGIFNLIKDEVTNSINVKEIPPDLSSDYMTYCTHICTALGQILLIKVAENKKQVLIYKRNFAKLLKIPSKMHSLF